MSMLPDKVQIDCPYPCCIDAALTWTCSKDIDLQHRHIDIDMDKQHRDGHVAWTWTCSIDMTMQHGHEIGTCSMCSG
jgi:hypothetical protein